MRIIGMILMMTLAIGCAPTNENFNPFDKEFKLHKNITLSDYDTIIGECGYWNYTNRITGSYYQFFLNEREIVAKGFNLKLNPIILEDTVNQTDPKHIFSILETHPVNLDMVKEKLQVYNVKQVRFIDDVDVISGIEITEESGSIQFASLSPYFADNKLIWQIQFFNGKDDK
ncbi:MAG: hypothetical protein QY309_14665 [Cyclobacteriaceae bacterium]|nr:MAG: hypothetical protein QY309_14665 [Cyclobacteriaceae bacterium]